MGFLIVKTVDLSTLTIGMESKMGAYLQLVLNTKVFPAKIFAVRTTSSRDVTQFGGTIHAEIFSVESHHRDKTYGDYFQELMESLYYMRYCYEWIEPFMSHEIFLAQYRLLVKELGIECSIGHNDSYEYIEWQKEVRKSNGIG